MDEWHTIHYLGDEDREDKLTNDREGRGLIKMDETTYVRRGKSS